jgi:hypothetical protein
MSDNESGPEMAPSDDSEGESLPLSARAPWPKRRKRGKAPVGATKSIAKKKKKAHDRGIPISPSEVLEQLAAGAGFDSVEAYELDRERRDNMVKAKDQANRNMHMTYVCPLTHGFFLSPVQWGDGHTYEESALKEYMAHQSPPYKSPITKEVIADSDYVPNVALRNALAHSIEAGVLIGGLVDEYNEGMKKREDDAKALAAIKERAERLDKDALKALGFAYYNGSYGLKKDVEKAFPSFKTAAALGDPTAMSMYGHMIVEGMGSLPLRPSMGMAFVGMAAGLGSEHAMYLLAQSYQTGLRGFVMDLDEAKRWYLNMGSAAHKDAGTRLRDIASNNLQCLNDAADGVRAQDGGGDENAGPFSPAYSPRSPSYSPRSPARSLMYSPMGRGFNVNAGYTPSRM